MSWLMRLVIGSMCAVAAALGLATGAWGAGLRDCPAGGAGDGDVLAAAAPYSEFVLGNARQINESEGKIAVAGDFVVSTAGDVGFRVGFTEPPTSERSLVVGRVLSSAGTFLQLLTDRPGVLGTASYGEAYVRGARDEGTFVHAPPPFSFGEEGAYLRALSGTLGDCRQSPDATRGTFHGAPGTLLLTGAGRRLNVFRLTTGELEQVRSVYLDVPIGSTTLVDVTGHDYSTEVAPLADFWVRDPTLPGSPFVQLAHCGLGTSCFFNTTDGPIGPRALPEGALEIENHLLFNFPELARFRKGAAAWAGALLAPRADLQWGTTPQDPTAGLGPFDGQLVVGSIDSGSSDGGLESHVSEHTAGDLLFRGRLPRPHEPEPPGPEPPTPPEPPVVIPPIHPPGTPQPPSPPLPPGFRPPPAPSSPIVAPGLPSTPHAPGTVGGERPAVSVTLPVTCRCGPVTVHVVVNRAHGPVHVAVMLGRRRIATTRRRVSALTLSPTELSSARRISAVLFAEHRRVRFVRVLRLCACPHHPPHFTG